MKKIERKKKKYSEKLFNELVLFYLLNRTGYFFEYEASFLLKVSSRTLRRYIREINETCILHRNGRGLEPYNQNGYKSYHVNLDFYNKETDPFKDAINPQSVLLPIGFCQKHPKGLDSKNQHMVRLTRCALLLHEMVNELRDVDSGCQTAKEGMDKCLFFYLEYININASLKTIKRDMKLVIDVIFFMKDK